MKNPFETVANLIVEYTDDIDDIETKDWLSTALISHLTTTTGYPEGYVKQCVRCFFDGFSV